MKKRTLKRTLSLLAAMLLLLSLLPVQVLAANEYNVSFSFDASLGSITVDGASPSAGSTVSSEGAALQASPAGDARFIGWINAETNEILSTSESYTLMPAADMSVRAVFARDGGTPVFMVGSKEAHTHKTEVTVIILPMTVNTVNYHTVTGTKIFEDFNAAAAEAAKIGGAAVLMNDAVLPAGSYTIPKNASVLIPYDDANTMFTSSVLNSGTYTKPTAYRTLTMASGANITVNGTLSISAVQKYAAGGSVDGGAPTGKVGMVEMTEGSNITVNTGGSLCAYGFVTGSGTVAVNSGGTVYEMFQFSDFRGGTQSSQMKNGVFALSQYYVQNIEVPMTLHHGAS